ncbi:hypothetical protein [Peptoniphilus vaginalis]|uniref:hypothetical protein n=1 Tax=Peptoniphilus vaginalis TaxID=1756987 RepID=UPI0023F9E2F7|nr:hypothetical protein [Peptoniphilus vaginalis]
MYYINFENDVFIDENIDLSHLKDLVRIYLNRCDSYQITILKEDKKSKKILDDFAVYSDENGYEYILQGIVDEDLKEMILKNLIGHMALNFMGLSLYDDGILKLEILNYGSEVYIYGFDKKTVVEFSDELEKVYGIREVNVYIDEMGQEESHGHDHHDHDHSCGCSSQEDQDKSCDCGGSSNN